MKRFLTEEDNIFTSAHIESNVKRLRDDFGVTISNPTDLQIVVPEAASRYKYLSGTHPIHRHRRSSLEKIASEVLNLPRLRKMDADQTNCHARDLDTLQVTYAAVDVYLSYEIANQLVIKDGYRFY